MEWREQSTVSCDVAFAEAQRWVEEVTRKTFGGRHFRSALENGVLLCDLINRIKPGIIKRVNRLSTPIAGLDNINVFLKACGKLGLKEAQLFHPGDLQDLSSRVTVNQEETSRRLKNVLITVYWLGRKAQVDPFYNGPHLNLKAFEGLLGIALSKALEESSSPKRSVRDSGFGDGWYTERDELYALQSAHRREASLDSLDSVESRTLSISSEATLKGSSEGCSSDTEADHRSGTMADGKDLLQFRRSQVIEPRTTTQFNQFLPSKDKPAAYVPAPLRKKRAERHEDNRRSWASPMYTEEDGTFTSGDRTGADSRPQNGYDIQPSVHHCSYEYESESDSDLERPEPDLVLDDLASRRFRSPPPVTPANYAVPSGLPSMATVPKAPQSSVAFLSSTSPSPPPSEMRTTPAYVAPRQPYYDSEDEDDEDEVGYADPVQDDLYTRKIGMPLLSSANVPYDKFLPKYWTSEEEAHVQRIKLGSQRRPWYRKMQGFSQKKSGSSSDDSDTDIAPWLVPAPPIRQQLDMATSNQYTPGGHTLPHLTTRSPHMQQYTVILPHTTQPQLGFSRPDPTAGPRVVRCAKGSMLGSRYPSEPHGAAQDVLPDLENDDMFARRTHSFHSGIDLSGWKPESRTSVAAPSWLEVSIVTQPRRGERVTPDIERDDLVFRKFNQPKTERPLSGAPDVYRAMPVPEPWSLPAKLQARLLCTPCPPEHREETSGRDRKCREHVTNDDMLLRRLGVGQPQGAGHPSPATQPIPGVPSSCNDADMNKWQAIREASRLRYKKKLMVERLLQKRSGRDGSKSVEDIPESSVLQQVRYEDLQRIRAQVKECEDKWQDDLTRWKNRRRSINSDIVKKKEEREQMELIASGSSIRRSRTFGEMQEERDSREQDSPGSNGSMLSSSSVQDSASEIRPLAKIQLGQNYTINTAPTQGPDASAPQSGPTQQLYSPALPSDSPTSLSDGPTSLTDGPALLSISPTPLMSSPPSSAQNSTYRGADTKRPSSSAEISASFSNQTLAAQPAERSPSTPYAPRSMEAKPGTARVSVSLPRSYQRADGSRLTSVVTPRPFGTQATRISSLPRSFIMDDSHKRFNGEAGTAHRASVPSRYSQFLTSEDEARSQSSSVQSSNEDEEEEEHQEELGPPSSSSNPGNSEVVPQPTLVPQLSTTTDGDSPQEYYSDMRISLNQKPNSSRDFGFQTSWDSTGARVKSVQPGSPAELCRLQVGDVVLAVGGRRVSDMSYDEWKGSLEAALQQGSLVMDVRRHGKNGGPEKHINSSLERKSGALSAETPTKTEEHRIQPVNDLPAKGVNGGFRDESVTMRNKEYESISLRNLKRRSEFFEQKGGSDSAISDLQVPSLSTTSNRWSWDPEEERRRQEKWQKEQERLLQEKYKRDQEKLEEEWRRAQQQVVKEDSESREDQKMSQLESRSSITLSSHQVPLSESTLPSLEDDQWEAARQREQEEEERRRREQEEWRQKGQEEEERTQSQSTEEEQESHRLQEQQQWEKSKSTPELDDVDKPAKRGEHGVRGGGAKSVLEQERRGNRGFRAQRSLAIANLEAKRRNILSTLSYRGPGRVSGGEGTWSRDSQRKRSTPLSQAELERQQILQEMKKKTQLLTDSSWIRQRSTSAVNKEPVNLGGHIRRGESLDNLDSARPWRPLSWSSVSASSAPSYSRPHSSLSTLSSASSLGYTRSGAATLPSSYSTGSLRQSPWSQPPSTSPTPLGAPTEEPASESRPPSQQRTSASAASPTLGVLNLELRSESETDSSTATPVISESKALSPPPCDLTLQQIEEEAN